VYSRTVGQASILMVEPVCEALHVLCECSAGQTTLLVDEAALCLRGCPISNNEDVETAVRYWLVIRGSNFHRHVIFKFL